MTPSAGAGGSISPSTPQSVNYNQTTTVTVTPSTGYHIASVNGTCGGSLVGNTYTTNAVTADCTAVVGFTINTYTITPSAGAGGSINPSTPQTVNYNATPSFNVTPSMGYHIASVNGTCGGLLVGNTYTTNAITADCTVSAVFTTNQYTVTASVGSNGRLDAATPSPAIVSEGATTSFKFNANSNYHVAGVSGCSGTPYNNSSNAVTTYTYTTGAIAADCAVDAAFAANQYALNVSKSGTGSGTVAGNAPHTEINCGSTCSASYDYNASVSLTATASTGSTFSGWSGACTGTGTCTVPTDATKSVTAGFTLNVTSHTILASAGNGGSISPTGSASVNNGGSQTFNITANSGYHVLDVVVDGVSVGAVSAYTFTSVTADHSITASFASNAATVCMQHGICLTFSQVTNVCSSSASVLGNPPAPLAAGYNPIGMYDIATCATYTGVIEVTIPYDESLVPSGREGTLRMFHWNSGMNQWESVPCSVYSAHNTITGRVNSLSPFGIGYYSSSTGYTTGANIYLIAILALIALTAGIFLIKRTQCHGKI